jgi:iron complex outermembrane recepter protein
VKQTAFFGSVDFDIIPKVLTVTAGSRHYKFENSFTGSVTGSFFCFEQGAAAGGCVNDGTNLNKKNLTFTESGTKSRGNITWHITPDVLLYATWSQGFRPGGFNRQGGPPAYIDGPDGKPQFAIPNEYHSDDLTNKEIGWKTEFFDRHLQVNGAVYQENWDNVQIGFFDPGETGNLAFGTNGQNFRIRGAELSIVARLSGLTLQGAASWNSSTQTNSPSLLDTNPASVNFGHAITQKCSGTGTNCKTISNLFGPPGAPSANSPPIQFNARGRYDWAINSYNAFVQVGGQHTGHSFTQSGNDPAISAGGINTTLLRFENPAYTTYDASLGLAKDAWTAHLFAQNLTNKETSLFTNTAQFAVAQTALRPRVLGVKFSYKF